MKPSSYYVGRRPGLFAILAAFLGWILFALMVGVAKLGERLERDFSEASVGDVIGSLLVLPIALLLFFALLCGRTATLQLLALWLTP